MESTTPSGINDDELNRMIANLQRDNSSTAAQTATQSSQMQTNATRSGVNVTPPQIANIQPPTVQSEAMPQASEPPVSTSDNLSAVNSSNGSLAEIKREAIVELRPLVDKLNLSPEDKFDTLLLLIRSTDDSSLVADAHETARQIADDTRRAQALLDVIKEIDYFSRQK